MLFKSLLSTALLAASTVISTVKATDLPAIEIVGNKFYYSNNGSQFYIRGVAYQSDVANSSSSSFSDPLADAAACKRDIPYLQELDTNVIRVYALNTSLDHTECMTLLQDAGIYVVADLSEPEKSIDRDDPAWNIDLLTRYTDVVDDFHNYTNILGFFAGNEVTNEVSNTDASAYVKAAIRDVKAYIKEMDYRAIPVGYSSNDDTAIRVSLADYFACGDEDVRADFFGINMYEWCGNSTFTESGYANITSEYKNLGIPAFFSEYGCNDVQPRLFTEVAALYSDEMTDVWSGGIVYMYYEETNNYGLVTIDDDKVSTLDDFNNYKTEIAEIDPTSATVGSSATTSSASVTTCPTIDADWEASTNLPPTPDKEVCNCMSASLTCVISDDVSSDDYADLYANVCGYINCDGISGNATTGEYGAYSACNTKDQLSFVLNLYYESQGKDSSACDWDGSASTASASTASSCSAILSSAGTSGLGTVAGSIDNATVDSNSASTGSSSSTSTSTSSSTSKTSGSIKQFSIDSLTKYVVVAGSLVFGAGLIFA